MNIDISKVSDIDHKCYIIQIFLNLKYDLIFHILLVLLLKIFFSEVRHRIIGHRSNEGNKTASEQYERYWFGRCPPVVQQSIVKLLIE